MRRCVILLWILAVLTVPVLALDVLEEERQILNVDTLTDGLPDDAQDALRTYSPAARTDPGEAILAIIKWASGLSVSTLREAVQTASLLLTAALVCQLVRQSVPDDRLHIQAMTGALAITLLFATNMKSMLGLAASVLDEMEAYSKLLLPVMCGAAAASGSLTGAGSLYMASSLFFQPAYLACPQSARAARICVHWPCRSRMRAARREARKRPAARGLVHNRAPEGCDVCVHGVSVP